MRNLYLVILALLIGCAKPFLKDDNNLTITAFSTSFDTKATETAFESGDVMGVFMENNASNLRYETSDGVSWKGYGNLTQFKTGDNVTAYYPYSETATNMNAIEISSGVDFMITEPTPITVVENQASAALNFKHVLSKLVVSMEIPEVIEGVKTVSLDSIVVKNVFRKAVINITDGKINGLTDKGDLRAFGNEIIVIPQQTSQKIKLVFKMANGTFDSLAYNAPVTFESGKKTTLNAVSNADLYFTSFLNLSSGEAQTDLPLSFYVAPGRTWTLTSSAPWLTFSATTGIGAATVKVNVAQNTGVPRTAIITLTDNKHAVATQKPMQHYVRTVTIAGTKWTTRNLTGVTQGQTSGFTLAASPQDHGMLWKWGSTFAYEHTGSGNPLGHWGGATTMSATYPQSGSGTGYDYIGLGGCSYPGDPCKTLGTYFTPTMAQWKTLCTSGTVWVTLNGKNGRLFGPHGTTANAIITAVPDNCIFIPAPGYRHYSNGVLYYEHLNGYYRSSSTHNSTSSENFLFDINSIITYNADARGYALSVRCVAD